MHGLPFLARPPASCVTPNTHLDLSVLSLCNISWCTLSGLHSKALTMLSEHCACSQVYCCCECVAAMLGMCPTQGCGGGSSDGDCCVAPGSWNFGWGIRSIMAVFSSCFISQLFSSHFIPWAVVGFDVPTEGRRKRTWAVGSGPDGESCGKEQGHPSQVHRCWATRQSRVGTSRGLWGTGPQSRSAGCRRAIRRRLVAFR